MLVEGQAGEGEAGYQGHESLDAVAKIPRDHYKAYSRLAANQHFRNAASQDLIQHWIYSTSESPL